MSNQQSPLKLYLLDINSQNKAILEFFVAGAGREFYTLVNNIDHAEVFITDFDFPDARQNWEELNLGGKPSLILAMTDPEVSEGEWLSKPMTSDALIDAAKKYMPRVNELRQSDKDVNQSISNKNVTSQSAPLSHHRIGSRVASSSPPFGASRAMPDVATSTPATPATVLPQEMVGLQGRPLVNVDEGGAITLERPLEKTDSPSEVFEEAKETATEALAVADNSVSESVSLLKGDTGSAELSKANAFASLNKKEIPTTFESVEGDQEVSLTEEEILDEQRRHSPVYTRDKLSPEQARVRWQELCGSRASYMRSELKDIRNTGYNRESHLQGSLIAALRLSKQTQQVVQMKYEPYKFFVIYEDSLIVSPLDPKAPEFTMLCSNAVRPGQINLHILDSVQSKEMLDSLEKNREFAFELESFIWTTCLVSSQGRLPTDFESENQYLLKHWPNFTRMENFPFAMRIAALWHYEPNRLCDVAEKLEIPQRYIIAFFNAAMGLSLFEQDLDKVQSKLIEPPKKKRSGIIARLFSRLAGGMSNT
ncbi:MAG: Unknown protein [uncultured Thiotrichaceae bacterium]|uniref:Uncharacterized protein n=1 Tax=uncultured Thiotrichaceae bacterium TaxID=298394 RepID=A0A6S6STM8_9GAMM|nr:MAG: Unknown protein [uncultured Thiotrichaceae bacterium]